MKNIRTSVFWPPLLCLMLGLGANFYEPAVFLSGMKSLNNAILARLGPVFMATVLMTFLVCLLIMVLPFGRVRLGGPQAKPLLTLWQWIAVSLCTNTAVGVLFWAAAEPLFHLTAPPKSLALAPGSLEAGQFALSTLYLHWSLLPCALYALPGAMFAFAFYNMHTEFSLAAALTPLLGKVTQRSSLRSTVDSLCLFALVAGMAASLATGTLTLSGGLEHLLKIKASHGMWLGVTLMVAVCFAVSAATGLKKGMSFLSKINLWVFLLLGLFVLMCGPTWTLVKQGALALGDFVTHFCSRATGEAFMPDDPWPRDWTVFYWAVWLAWAPVTAVFLGRIGYGYRVRSFMIVNLFIPALFAVLWMGIFGGYTLHLELQGGLLLKDLLQSKGPESIIYAVLNSLPWHGLVVPIFLFTVFVSYVSGADANTSAMAAMCSRTISRENTEPSLALKMIWAFVIASTSLVMLFGAGLDGIKMISNLGGVPALFYQIAILLAGLCVAWAPQRFDRYSQVFSGEPEIQDLNSIAHQPKAASGDI